MFRAQVIGNLGFDARVEQNNGRPFVSFNLAHNDRYTKEDGTIVEKSQWISCAMNGDGGNLLQFLKKGRQVYVEGRCSTRVFSSEKERRMVAGVNISVDHLELIGSQSDDVPGRLFDEEGIMHNVGKLFWIENSESAIILNGRDKAILTTPQGQRYQLTAPCWVSPFKEETQQADEQIEVFDGEQSEEAKKIVRSQKKKS